MNTLIPDNLLVMISLAMLALGFLVQMYYLFFIFLRVARYRTPEKKGETPPVSVIICARDEAGNLERFLPAVLSQEYPEFEVIVVNDCSEDHTETVLETLRTRYPALKVSTIRKDEKFRHGKKLALTIGIKASKYDWLLLTDADCEPAGPHWIRDMLLKFDKGTDFVLGYGGYFAGKGLLNLLIRMDSSWIAMQYLGSALAGKPYMGVGRNLAYRKKIFFENRGFASHSHLESGDDDLFVNAHAREANTRVSLEHSTHTRSIPAGSWSEWLLQKRRHHSTGGRYRSSSKWLLGMEWFSRMLFFAGVVLLLVFYEPWYIPLAVFLLRWLILAVIFKFVMRSLNEKNLLLSSLVFDLFQPILNLLFFLSGQVYARKNKWK